MLEDTDVDAAVAAGILTPAQAVALREIAAGRTRERAITHGHEERFRFMRGFNDIFFAVGVVLFVYGLTYFAGNGAAGQALIAVIVWALAELLVGRMRLVLPGIILAFSFAMFVFTSVDTFWFGSSDISGPIRIGGPIQIGPPQPSGILFGILSVMPGGAIAFGVKMLCAAFAAGLFYVRFRLPFALLLLAAGLIGAVLGGVGYYLPTPPRWFESLTVLACGLSVFVAAMAFDISDRERLTRRTDCAFWLHLLAAPLMVHSLISLAIGGLESMKVAVAAIVLIVGVLAVVAIAIDRRALLVSGLSYLGFAIGYTLSGAAGNTADARAATVAATLVILGAFVLALGVGWMPLRRRVIALLSAPVANRLPPVPVRS